MNESTETRADRALGTLWSFTWPLLFLCTMTVLSVATQKYSGYVDAQPTAAQTAQQPSSASIQ